MTLHFVPQDLCHFRAPTVLLPLLVEMCPSVYRQANIHESYFQHLFHLTTYLPRHRIEILSLIVDHLLKLDVSFLQMLMILRVWTHRHDLSVVSIQHGVPTFYFGGGCHGSGNVFKRGSVSPFYCTFFGILHVHCAFQVHAPKHEIEDSEDSDEEDELFAMVKSAGTNTC